MNKGVIDYLRSGLALVPVPVGKKGPVTEGWNLRENVVTSCRDLEKLAGKNVGLAHAHCSPTATCAIDIDDYKWAKAWFDRYRIGLKSLLFSPDAVVIWSGRKNRIKLVYRLPSTSGPLLTKQLQSDDGKTMLELRCASQNGSSMQDLLPPSLHPSGKKYVWLGEGDPVQIPTIPETLLAVWQEMISSDSRTLTRSGQASLYARGETPREVARVERMLARISADCDYVIWRDIVWGLLSTDWSVASELARHWSKTSEDRFDENVFSKLIGSYDPSHVRRPTVGTVVHYARRGGWDE